MLSETPDLRGYSLRHRDFSHSWGCTIRRWHGRDENGLNLRQILLVMNSEGGKQVPEIVVTICGLVRVCVQATPKNLSLTYVIRLIFAIEDVHPRLVKFWEISNEKPLCSLRAYIADLSRPH